MHSRKIQYSNHIYKLVETICERVSEEKSHIFPSILNVSPDDAKELINKILIALPDKYFYESTHLMRYEMFAHISKNFVLFQCQEDINAENYPYHLIDFINNLSKGIAYKFNFI